LGANTSVTEPDNEGSTSVFVVDDQEIVAEGLLIALGTVPGLRAAGRATSAAEAIEALALIQPDVVIIDRQLPDGSGIELAARIVIAFPGTGVVILAGHPDSSSLAAALEAGCRGYLAKRSTFDSLVSTVRRVVVGEVAIPAGMLQDLARHLDPRRVRPAEELTAREREVLVLLAGGSSTDDIARTLELSSHTVRTHVRSILHKLNAHSRLQAVSTARALELLDRS
jgi:DNA-binding NarL/FixJ family response regulator